ncbi:LysM peptidoglycan-binding domain-containing protein [Candidatus Microgenomates bacterium]|nr:MAG: LysM peptidoglycan-binding domain-containing protein [Candidatus Microgenomates bacterium]
MATKKPVAPKPDMQNEEMSESYISIGLGLLVVVVIGILVYNYFTQRNAGQTPPPAQEITQESTTSAQPGTTYVVTEGDTLWSISEKAYGIGYNWRAIADANSLSDTDQLEKGQELTIPEVSAEPEASEIAMETSPEASAMMVEEMEATPEPTPQASPVVSPSPVASATPAASVMAQASPQASPEASVTPEAAPETQITGDTYTVVHGDTLWSIACRAYGDCYQWTKIAQANDLTNPGLIHPGNEFSIPR